MGLRKKKRSLSDMRTPGEIYADLLEVSRLADIGILTKTETKHRCVKLIREEREFDEAYKREKGRMS